MVEAMPIDGEPMHAARQGDAQAREAADGGGGAPDGHGALGDATAAAGKGDGR